MTHDQAGIYPTITKSSRWTQHRAFHKHQRLTLFLFEANASGLLLLPSKVNTRCEGGSETSLGLPCPITGHCLTIISHT